MRTRRQAPASRRLGAFLLLFCLLSWGWQQPAQADVADHVVINELQTDSVDGTGGAEDDWLELYNPTGTDVVLDGWSLQRSTSGGTVYSQALSGTILAGDYFLVVSGNCDEAGLIDQADLITTTSFTLSDNNAVYLVNDDETVVAGSADANIVDLVGWGGITYGETAAYPDNVTGGLSLARVPDGEDNDNNADDLAVGAPSPQNSSANPSNGYNVDGEVLVTVAMDSPAVSNISPTAADINFSVNADGQAWVDYGLDAAYGLVSPAQSVGANDPATISLSGLACDTTYHYRVYAENTAGDSSDQSDDASFTTLPCGIEVSNIVMTKSQARADNDYTSGWEWQIDITVWNDAENALKMKFNTWNGPAPLPAGGNMQFSVDGSNWIDIESDGDYSPASADITGLDDSGDPGRQFFVIVRMKVPADTLAGTYNSSYGILTE